MLICIIPGCSSTSQNSEFSFFEIPSKSTIREKWIELINSHKRVINDSPWMPNDRDVVCSKHFCINDFRDTLKKKMLKPNVIPSIFSNSPDELAPVYKKIPKIVDEISQTSEDMELHNICRICGIKNAQMMGIFDDEGLEHDIPNLIGMYLPIKVDEKDRCISRSICYQCSSGLVSWHEIYQQSINVDEQLKQLLRTNEHTNLRKHFSHEVDTSPYDDQAENKILKPNENFPIQKTDDYECFENINKSITSDEVHQLTSHHNVASSIEIILEDEEKENSTLCLENQLPQSNSFIPDVSVDSTATNFPKPSTDAENKTFNYSVVRLYQCNICKYTVKTGYDFRKHMLSHKSTNSYTCNICGTSFTLKKVMESHIRTDHSTRRRMKKTDPEIDKRCFQCSKKFTTKISLQIHLHTRHWDGEVYVCDVCETTFTDMDDYQKHIKENNHCTLGPIPKPCTSCGLDFESRIRLKTHIAIKHGQGVKCSVCGVVLQTYQEFQNHEALHPQLRPFKCEFCGKNFKRSTDYKKHQIIHTGERPHICEVCGKSFNRKHNMQMHRRAHFNEKPFVCTTCNMSFFRMGDLRKHKQLHYLKKAASNK